MAERQPTGLLKGRSTVNVLENQDFGVCAAQNPPKPGFLQFECSNFGYSGVFEGRRAIFVYFEQVDPDGTRF